MAAEKAALRAYVTGADSVAFANLAPGSVALTVTHSLLNQRVLELRFDLSTTIAAVKRKLYT